MPSSRVESTPSPPASRSERRIDGSARPPSGRDAAPPTQPPTCRSEARRSAIARIAGRRRASRSIIPILLLLIALGGLRRGLASAEPFGLASSSTSDWDRGQRQVRCGAGGLRYRRLVAHRALIATPLAVGVAIFLSEFAPRWLRQPVAFLVDLLAAIPSVVYGLWGLLVLCRSFAIT